MCAGTVVTPPGDTSAPIVSITSRSRSVALKASLERSARISTLARIGMVLRRSTTRWTCDSDFKSSARSTRRRTLKLTRRTRRFKSNGGAGLLPRSLLQLALQRLDLFGQRGVVADQVLDLAHRMQDGGVIAPPEAPPDLGQ